VLHARRARAQALTFIHKHIYSFVCGVIDRKKLAGFERLLWRACRGNIFVKWEEIDEPLIDPRTVGSDGAAAYLNSCA
jgi:V-type H+-transporting ATPase subunit a